MGNWEGPGSRVPWLPLGSSSQVLQGMDRGGISQVESLEGTPDCLW